ncbi:hypothetical protein COCVIDRAFT_13339 [Bipolaris victoriae FI3]|uniref:Uncharacterized protein n=1 Tax=Bipolaris victoriae (strain FI3) TaxID=930091 RepID=W7EQ20_BIPV3|nr:hypothetical protein COCVIDRAFT_13339 [Bipolaris victoriae FI3]
MSRNGCKGVPTVPAGIRPWKRETRRHARIASAGAADPDDGCYVYGGSLEQIAADKCIKDVKVLSLDQSPPIWSRERTDAQHGLYRFFACLVRNQTRLPQHDSNRSMYTRSADKCTVKLAEGIKSSNDASHPSALKSGLEPWHWSSAPSTANLSLHAWHDVEMSRRS